MSLRNSRHPVAFVIAVFTERQTQTRRTENLLCRTEVRKVYSGVRIAASTCCCGRGRPAWILTPVLLARAHIQSGRRCR